MSLVVPSIEDIRKHLKFETFNAIQQEAIEKSKDANELVVLAPTGSGKTIAFLLPIIQRIDPNLKEVQCVIVAPSRELSLQIEQVFKSLGTPLKVNCCYGGHSMKVEMNNMQNPPHVLIGTPGRLADHIEKESFDYSAVEAIVLDEFDKALEFGFKDDMSFIIEELRAVNFKMLTSATKSDELPEFTKIESPVTIDYLGDQVPPKLNLQMVYAKGVDKLYSLLKLICHLKAEPMLIFCNHRAAVDRISEILKEKGIAHESFHGGLDQEERERALTKFRNGSASVFITTDLAARGLDIPDIKHVIHYQLPPKEDAFIHRNGRTARMDKDGDAYLVLSEEDKLPEYIEKKPQNLHVPSNVEIPALPKWVTLYISGGKKNKINKIDIVGLLMKKGGLSKDELGLIEVKDFISFVAVDRKKAKEVCELVNKERVKKLRLRVAIAR
ncbi:DEAD/DEAH box helicase [Flammeovirga kamogawensis]|uniref:DEAD/DEAH box helicase n=1 Tax=Flammeovirga kamogawensis TaxID=373891 RepID=A0ABX8H312_9BACT|nr:DEAD/DEAH box helicase [Flammeovirga kamogawensis]MBB6463945.1 ATP-independent RNA helicase DbpA [Flammeovirga kamogawensis]QWG09777.1 DEAD/DEAH box helicase [Flammeovirga kamogawensis]TRX65287.1 DEAD/DEAH box helicase [Flammeovirga kamogawensis]